MSWRDALSLARRNASRRPGRVALTVLSVALATALLTALVTIAQTAQTRVLDQLSKGGPVSGINVSPARPDPEQVDQDKPRVGEARDLDEAAVQQIAELPQVSRVLPVVTAGVFVTSPSTTASGRPIRPFVERMVGIDMGRPGLLPITLLAGRLPQDGSLVDVAVTESWLKRLGLQRVDASRVIGTEITLAAGRVIGHNQDDIHGRWTRLTVVGVVAQGAGSGQLVAPIEQAQLARGWTVAGTDGGEELGASSSPYSGLLVVARGIDNVGPARDAITAIGYSSSAPENLIASVDNYLGVVEIVLTAVGLIALVVAALGITNALLASVRERRREIGVLKAIGARDRDVLRLFLIEAFVLGMAGGVLGTFTGAAVARVVGAVVNGYLADQGLAGVRLTVSPVVIGGGVAGATALAVLGGIAPAWRAARLPAVEAVSA